MRRITLRNAQKEIDIYVGQEGMISLPQFMSHSKACPKRHCGESNTGFTQGWRRIDNVKGILGKKNEILSIYKTVSITTRA